MSTIETKQSTIKQIGGFTALIILIFWGIAYYQNSSKPHPLTGEAPYLNIYNWYGMIPEPLIKQFEEETGIQIKYDLYDNNEILEAKLLAGSSGYDIVFPSASPYVDREIRAGAFRKLDKSLLPNLRHLDPEFVERMANVDPDLTYSIPFFWGTFGIAYVEEIVRERMPDAPVDSYRMLFDPEVVSRFYSCGVSILDEAVDVYPAILSYLGLDPQSTDLDDLRIAQEHLLKIRPSISRFLGQRFANELVAGEICMCQAWSGDIQLAQLQAKESKKKLTIQYVVPKEGGTLWIDAMCIPKDGPHPKNAHLFANFLMRPEISAAITNSVSYPTTNKSAMAFIHKDILNDKTVFPSPDIMKRLRLDKIQNSGYEEIRTRYWFLAKQGA